MKACTRKTAWLGLGVALAALVWFTAIAPAFSEVTGLNTPLMELPVVQTQSIILVSGTFTCDRSIVDCNTAKVGLNLRGTVVDLDGAGVVSFNVNPDTVGLVSPKTIPFAAEITLDSVAPPLEGVATASIAFESSVKGTWTASAYVTHAASLEANGDVKVGIESTGSLVLSPYLVGLADPRPSPFLAVFEPND